MNIFRWGLIRQCAFFCFSFVIVRLERMKRRLIPNRSVGVLDFPLWLSIEDVVDEIFVRADGEKRNIPVTDNTEMMRFFSVPKDQGWDVIFTWCHFGSNYSEKRGRSFSLFLWLKRNLLSVLSHTWFSSENPSCNTCNCSTHISSLPSMK